ncbi:MAG: phosphatase PAP2 family protein [Gemmatimonadaceae bacterium]|nr:phosphatase PAP2 family protein [Chitinophagaceae bacterium]
MRQIFFLLLVVFTAACTSSDGPVITVDTYSSATVLKWNLAATNFVKRSQGFSPMPESRAYAMVNLAMHDALNNIVPKYETYAYHVKDPLADPNAAVVQSAHDVMVFLWPALSSSADSLLSVYLAEVPNGSAKDKGITLGKSVAAAMLQLRKDDGASVAQYPVAEGVNPGEYRSVAPLAGFIILPGWGKVKPFSILNANAFRPLPPYALASAEYTADYNEIKTMGCLNCPARTADQTQLGVFWLDNVPLSWNSIAVKLVEEKKWNGWKTARTLALLHIAEADANIAVFEAKYFYYYWRPVSAVRLGESDGNPQTAGDPAWTILAPPTPPAPDYPSNHAADGGAAAEILRDAAGTDNFSFSITSNSLPNVSRSFKSFSQAATETSLSRIYVGFHFRRAVVEGEAMGRRIGKFVVENSLKPY